MHSIGRSDRVGKSVSYRDILRHGVNRMSQGQIASVCGCGSKLGETSHVGPMGMAPREKTSLA